MSTRSSALSRRCDSNKSRPQISMSSSPSSSPSLHWTKKRRLYTVPSWVQFGASPTTWRPTVCPRWTGAKSWWVHRRRRSLQINTPVRSAFDLEWRSVKFNRTCVVNVWTFFVVVIECVCAKANRGRRFVSAHFVRFAFNVGDSLLLFLLSRIVIEDTHSGFGIRIARLQTISNYF